MKRIHLARVEAPPEAFRALVEAAGRLGLRVGWLGLAPEQPALVETLAASTDAGFAVGGLIGAATTVIVRARAGPAHLWDVLRQSYLGCRLVLVHGELVGVPTLAPGPAGYEILLPGGGRRELEAEALAGLLRKPHPWPQPERRG